MVSPQSQTSSCPECGGRHVDGLTCWEQLGILLSWEWQDPQLLAVHFLTVASYNLQHGAQFTPEALDALRRQFIEHLDQGVAVAEIRRRVARAAEGSTRVLRPQAERRPVLRRWSMTIADVYFGNQPQGAAERVKAWAALIRHELDTQ
jgi:hypothetical protein